MAMGIDPGWAKCGIGAVALSEGQLVSAGVRLVRTAKNKDKRFQHLRVSMDDERRHHEYYDAFCESIETLKPHVIGVEVYTIHETREYEKLRDQAARFMGFLGLGGKSKTAAFRTPEEFRELMARADIFKKMVAHLDALNQAVDAFKVVRGRGAAAKTYGVYTAAMCAAWRYEVPIFGFMPVDLKKGACGKAGASKKEVEDALCGRISGLRDKVDEKIKAKTMHEHVFDASGHAMLALTEYQRWMRDSQLAQAGAAG